LIEMGGTVYTALPAVAQCGAAHGAFECGVHHATGAQLHEMTRAGLAG